MRNSETGSGGSPPPPRSSAINAPEPDFSISAAATVRVVMRDMTAKQKLRATVEELSETDAADALDYIVSRRHGDRDALGELLGNAPLDDEPTSPEEEEGLR